MFASATKKKKNASQIGLTCFHIGEPALTALCHCTDCQKWTGGGFASNVAVPTTAYKLLTGTPKSWVRKGISGMDHPHFFCGGKFTVEQLHTRQQGQTEI